jgi:3-methyladenine DNA glycosylase AlkD
MPTVKSTADSTEIARFVAREFCKQANAKKAKEMAAYMKTTMPFYGVQKPDRLPVFKELTSKFRPSTQKEYEANVLSLWNQKHREEKYAALEYATYFKPFICQESMPLYERLIREGAWWDFVDVIAIHLVGTVLLDDRRPTQKMLDHFVQDEDMWIRRTAILAHNRHKEETDAAKLFKHCLLLAPEKEFFIRKAIGWALREYAYTAPQAVRRFVKENNEQLSPLSVREALKRIG